MAVGMYVKHATKEGSVHEYCTQNNSNLAARIKGGWLMFTGPVHGIVWMIEYAHKYIYI